MSHRIEHLDMTVVTNRKMKTIAKCLHNWGEETISLPYLVG